MSQSPPSALSSAEGDDALPRVRWSDAESVRVLLRDGVAIELLAKGRSMEPTLREGQPLRVEPLAGPNDVPRVGEVVLVERFREPLALLLHRVAERRGRLLVLEGDATLGPDDGLHPVSRVLGRVAGYEEPAWRFAWRRRRKRLRAAWKESWRRLLGWNSGQVDPAAPPRAAWMRALLLWSKELRDEGAEPPILDDAAWAWLSRERLAGAAAYLAMDGRAVPGEDGPSPAAVVADLERRRLAMERALIVAEAALGRAGVAAAAMRGGSLANAWPNAAARESSDVDLLVPPADVPKAVEALLATGAWRLEQGDAGLWSDDNYRSDLLRLGNRLHLAPAEGAAATPPLEVHWRPLPREGAMLLFGAIEPPTPSKAGLRELSPEDELLLGALHWAKHHFRPLRDPFDAAALLRAAGKRLDWEALARRARAAGVERLLFARLWSARELFGASVPPAALRSLAPARAVRAALEARFGARALIQRSTAPSSLRERALDLALSSVPSARRWYGLARWWLSPGWPYLLETYGGSRDEQGIARRIAGGWLRAWHRFLWSWTGGPPARHRPDKRS